MPQSPPTPSPGLQPANLPLPHCGTDLVLCEHVYILIIVSSPFYLSKCFFFYNRFSTNYSALISLAAVRLYFSAWGGGAGWPEVAGEGRLSQFDFLLSLSVQTNLELTFE